MDLPAITSLLPVYRRYDLAFARGEGSWLWTTDGRRMLDFCSGIAVTGLGHAHPRLVAALTEQAGRLWHVSNLFQIPELQKLADRLVASTFADTVFVCNSGAEAIEAAVKMARRHFWARGMPERNRIVTFQGAFHGRTMAGISAVGSKKMVEGFDPLLPGFDILPFGDQMRYGRRSGRKPPRSWSSRSRARAASGCCRSSPCGACGACATSTACC